MTREEAIRALRYERKTALHENKSAFDMAIKALSAEPCEDCISREFIEIVVDYPPADLCTYSEYKGKPYFSIKYKENGKEYVGFGTYKIEILSQWLKEYFMSNIQPKTESENEK